MTSAKLLSAIEPVIRYHRSRFRGSSVAHPGSPRYELGLQLKEDAVHRLVDVWAAGEASASLGFAAARLFDELDPLEKVKDEALAARGISGSAVLKSRRQTSRDAVAFLHGQRPELAGDVLDPVRASRFRGQRAVPGVQAVEYRPRRADDAGSGEPDGRLRHHRGLPRLPGAQVDGRAAGGHLRRAGSGAAAAAQRDHGGRAVPGAVPRVDAGDARPSPTTVPAPAPARWPPPCRCGCGRCSTC